jgi:protein SCO1
MRAILIVCLCFLGSVGRGETASPVAGPLPNVTLVNQDDVSFKLHALKGQYVFLSFLYTHCPLPEACPLTVLKAKQLGRWWVQKLPQVPFRILLVTLDPKRDTPAELKKFGQKRGLDFEHYTFATGQTEMIQILKKALAVDGRQASDGNFYHDSTSFLLDPKLVLINAFAENQWEAKTVLCSLGIEIPLCARPAQASARLRSGPRAALLRSGALK